MKDIRIKNLSIKFTRIPSGDFFKTGFIKCKKRMLEINMTDDIQLKYDNTHNCYFLVDYGKTINYTMLRFVPSWNIILEEYTRECNYDMVKTRLYKKVIACSKKVDCFGGIHNRKELSDLPLFELL